VWTIGASECVSLRLPTSESSGMLPPPDRLVCARLSALAARAYVVFQKSCTVGCFRVSLVSYPGMLLHAHRNDIWPTLRSLCFAHIPPSASTFVLTCIITQRSENSCVAASLLDRSSRELESLMPTPLATAITAFADAAAFGVDSYLTLILVLTFGASECVSLHVSTSESSDILPHSDPSNEGASVHRLPPLPGH
jgi:hypothetical protein